MTGVNWPLASANIREAFLDPGLQERVDRDGFVVVPFIDHERIDQLRELFASMDSGIKSGFYVSMHSRQAEHRVAVGEGLARICGELPGRYLRDYELLLGTYAVKIPGPDSTQGVHQDLSFVDETKFVSVNCWFPLARVGPEDGRLMVMKGSHRLFPSVRGPVQPLFQAPGLRDVIVDRYLTTLDVAPGEAVMFSSRLVHYSPPNRGAHPRLAVSLTTIPAEATPRFYCPHPEGGMELLEVASDFFYRFDPTTRPTSGTSLGRVPFDPSEISSADIERFYDQNPELR